MNPVIKFTTLFGLLAVELALRVDTTVKIGAFVVFLGIALVFVWRSFYGMRIKTGAAAAEETAAPAASAHG